MQHLNEIVFGVTVLAVNLKMFYEVAQYFYSYIWQVLGVCHMQLDMQTVCN